MNKVFILKICDQVIIKLFFPIVGIECLYIDFKLRTNEFMKDRKDSGDLRLFLGSIFENSCKK